MSGECEDKIDDVDRQEEPNCYSLRPFQLTLLLLTINHLHLPTASLFTNAPFPRQSLRSVRIRPFSDSRRDLPVAFGFVGENVIPPRAIVRRNKNALCSSLGAARSRGSLPDHAPMRKIYSSDGQRTWSKCSMIIPTELSAWHSTIPRSADAREP